MRIFKMLVVLLFIAFKAQGQVNKEVAIEDLRNKKLEIDNLKIQYEEAKKLLNSYSQNLSSKTMEQFKLAVQVKRKLDSLYQAHFYFKRVL